jgi:hypothetical protein
MLVRRSTKISKQCFVNKESNMFWQIAFFVMLSIFFFVISAFAALGDEVGGFVSGLCRVPKKKPSLLPSASSFFLVLSGASIGFALYLLFFR